MEKVCTFCTFLRKRFSCPTASTFLRVHKKVHGLFLCTFCTFLRETIVMIAQTINRDFVRNINPNPYRHDPLIRYPAPIRVPSPAGGRKDPPAEGRERPRRRRGGHHGNNREGDLYA